MRQKKDKSLEYVALLEGRGLSRTKDQRTEWVIRLPVGTINNWSGLVHIKNTKVHEFIVFGEKEKMSLVTFG